MTKGKLISPTDFFIGSTILGGIWHELTNEKYLEHLMELRVGISGLAGHLRICLDSTVRAQNSDHQDPKSVRREINNLPEIRHFFESLSRSHKMAQICQNLQKFPIPILTDMLKVELPAVGALLLRFLEEKRRDDVIKNLDGERQKEILEHLKINESSKATELMLATLGFLTYAPLAVQSPHEHTADDVEQKHLAKVH